MTTAWILVLLLTTPMELGMLRMAQAQEPGAGQRYIYSQQKLDELLAPIALYPDTLLSQILMASTYPLEVVEADRWLKQNQNLTEDALDKALMEQPWDVSVKSLCHFPKVLSMLDEKLPETTDLGNAFLGQQNQVMDTVQRLRARAQAQGNLTSTEQQKVIVQDRNISIEPAYPDVVYIPAYDPCWVYGPWWYPACDPLWFWYPDLVIGVGFFWGPRIFVGPIDFWCGFHWHRHSIFVNVNKTAFISRIGATRMHGGMETWAHNPVHRRGVAYHDSETSMRFGRAVMPGVEPRRAFRGFGAQGPGAAPGRQENREMPLAQPRPSSRSIHSDSGMEKPNGGNAFHGFEHGSLESHQQSERGWQSMQGGHSGGGSARGGSIWQGGQGGGRSYRGR